MAAAPVEAAAIAPCPDIKGLPDPALCSTHEDMFPGARTGVRTGPEAAGPRLTARQADAAADAAPAQIACEGDGVSGKRVQMLYVREPSMPDRYNQFMPMFQAWLASADDVFNDAAAEKGQSRHIRFVTKTVPGGCQIVIQPVVVPAGSLATLASSIAALRGLGYELPDRKYFMFTESTALCGTAQLYKDDRPGPENYNNFATTYGRVDATPNCFGANAFTHELGHALGAVQTSAPNSDGKGHCSDLYSTMCYGGTPTWSCPEWKSNLVPDCNHDDYFNMAPEPGSYLDTHWNIANNDFLIKGNTAASAPHPTIGLTYVITNVSTGGAMEPVGGSAASMARLSQRARTNKPSQKWLMGYKTGLQFVNMNSRMCVDSAYEGTVPGTQAVQYGCKGSDAMRWTYLSQTDGSHAIINWKSGLALTAVAAYPAPLQQQPYTGAANQRWKFNRMTDAGLVNGATHYLTGIGTRENAEVLKASKTSGAAITHAAAAGTKNQQWKLRKLTSPASSWQLVNANSGMCMGLKTANATAGTQIVQSACSTATSSRQAWLLRRVADGTYLVVNAHSQRVLNMTAGSLSVLTQQVLAADQSSQIWALKPL
ncbi:RICIN domain-containing protein [Streptosporangium sp. NBC_01469]|uniref:RICIN domain-containing protein n=1 Tax=Streptosporangium sp. NBC_01469 TaxID=2903898 RepID=UPI002E2CE360|nr:RICIN domain-containing protein [Streptosporangium sp. NBC_01469]